MLASQTASEPGVTLRLRLIEAVKDCSGGQALNSSCFRTFERCALPITSIMDLAAGPADGNAAPTNPVCRDPRRVMSKFLGDKEEEWEAMTRKGPLNLLDLPIDILKEIVREVSDPSWLARILLTSYPR